MRICPGKRASSAVLIAAWLPVLAAAQEVKPALHGHVPSAVARSRVMGRVAPTNRMDLAVGLSLRNTEELDRLLQQLPDRASPNYRAFLSPAEFAERFGPSEQDYQSLIGFLQGNGLTVTGTHPNRTIVDVSGSVADIERVFHVNLLRYGHPTRGVFYAPDREPSLDFVGPVAAITGLDNFVVPRPMDLQATAIPSGSPLAKGTGSGVSGLFTGTDFRAAYAPDVKLTGAGQTVGLFELDGFSTNDVALNFAWAGLPPVPTETVLLDGFSGNPGSASTNIEVVLDIMMASYMAPGLSKVIVYEGTNWNDVLNRMATENRASQLSCSWVFSPINATTEQIFKQFIAQGQTFFAAAGDSGGFNGGIWPPADNPNVTVVGGTSLTTAGAGGPWQSEAAWSKGGGGISSTYPIPSYQQTTSLAAAHGSLTMRNVPDVATIADEQIFLIANSGALYIGGTSAAAPLWAGFLALVNQQAASFGNQPVGFLNPLLYSIGNSSNYALEMHDVSIGSNGFPAISGYDLATGWGSPAGQQLIDDLTGAAGQPTFSLATSPTALSLQPGTSVTTTITVTPNHGFSGSVALAASGLPAGVTASFSPSITEGSSTLTLTAGNTVSPGPATVTVTGISGPLTSAAALNLTVAAPNFSLMLSRSALSIRAGGSGVTVVSIKPTDGFTGNVALTAANLPAGVSAVFSPSSTAGTSTLTITAGSTAAPESAEIIVTGVSGTLESSVNLAIEIQAQPSFSLAAASPAISLKQGMTVSTVITVAPLNGFRGTVSLSAAGLPKGVTAQFSGGATGLVTMTASAAASAVIGSREFTVTGSSEGITQTITMGLTVIPSPNAGARPGRRP